MDTELQKAQISGNVVQSDIGPIHILESDSKLQSLFKEASRETLLRSERLIKADEGGDIKISDDLLGHIKINFKKRICGRTPKIFLKKYKALRSRRFCRYP